MNSEEAQTRERRWRNNGYLGDTATCWTITDCVLLFQEERVALWTLEVGMAAGSITTFPTGSDDGGSSPFPPGNFKDPKRLYCKNGGFFLRINSDGKVDGSREKGDSHSKCSGGHDFGLCICILYEIYRWVNRVVLTVWQLPDIQLHMGDIKSQHNLAHKPLVVKIDTFDTQLKISRVCFSD